MTDELDLLRSFRSDIPGPSTDAWARARAAIALAEPTANATDTAIPLRSQLHRSLRRRLRLPVAAAAAVVVALGVLAGVGVIGGGGGLSRPFTTPWRPAHALGEPGSAHERAGTWRLVDALLTGTWQQNVYGPPPGSSSCTPDGTCYVLAGKYASASSASPLSESLYVSTNEGATWSALPVPSGFLSTTSFECSGPQWCATGGTYNGQPVLAVTRNGGHSFTIDPLPTGVGTLRSLSCPSGGVCIGLVATGHAPPMGVTLLVTDDGGSTFRDEPILAGDAMVDLACTSSTDCTVVGSTDASANARLPVGVSAVTTDQGRTWRSGSFPTGFGISADSTSLACADAEHCFVTGAIPIPVHNPPRCASISMPSTFKTPPPGTHGMPAMSPKVASISRTETRLAAAAAAQEEQVTTGVTSCTNSRVTTVSGVASSSNGGLTWTLEELPADVPSPRLNGLSCPTTTECWAAGTELVPEKAGRASDMSSPVLIGTTDAGSTWSKVVFSVPPTAPNATGQSYLSMGSVTCPTATVCLAGGAAAQNSPYAPVYSLIVPSS